MKMTDSYIHRRMPNDSSTTNAFHTQTKRVLKKEESYEKTKELMKIEEEEIKAEKEEAEALLERERRIKARIDPLLNWSFIESFPFLNIENKVSFLNDMDAVRKPDNITVLSEEAENLLLYCQFWSVLSNHLQTTPDSYSCEALWFKVDTYLTDCYWFDVLHKLLNLFSLIEDHVRNDLTTFFTTSSVDDMGIALESLSSFLSLASKSFGCKTYVLQNIEKIHKIPIPVKLAITKLTDTFNNVRCHLLFLISWQKLSELSEISVEQDLKLSLCFITAFYEAQQKDNESELLTSDNLNKFRIKYLQTWSEYLLIQGQFSQAFDLVNEEPTLKAFAKRIKDATNGDEVSETTMKKPPRFDAPILMRGQDPLKEDTMKWILECKE